MASPCTTIADKKALAAANKQRKKAARVYLPDDYEPHEQDVLIGRGRRVENHKGNHRFHGLIQAHLVAYYNAQTKATKTTIILRIFQDIKLTAQADGGSGFIKQDSSSKRWFVIEDSAARISIAQAFRDALASQYKSSKHYKQRKRREQGRLCLQEHAETMMASQGAPFGQFGGSFLSSKTESLSMLPPPPLVPMVSSDGTDLSHRRSFGGIMDTTGSNVVLDHEEPEDKGLFLSLFSAFGSNPNPTNDPFQPTPLAEQEPKRGQIWAEVPLQNVSMPESTFLNNLVMSPSCHNTTQQQTPKKELVEADPLLQPLPVLPTSTTMTTTSQDVFQILDTAPVSDIRTAFSA